MLGCKIHSSALTLDILGILPICQSDLLLRLDSVNCEQFTGLMVKLLLEEPRAEVLPRLQVRHLVGWIALLCCNEQAVADRAPLVTRGCRDQVFEIRSLFYVLHHQLLF